MLAIKQTPPAGRLDQKPHSPSSFLLQHVHPLPLLPSPWSATLRLATSVLGLAQVGVWGAMEQ
jgi:hypothetical protein